MNVKKTVWANQQERSDTELLNAFLHSASQEVFETVVRRYLGMVLGIAARKTGNHELAKEVAQNVFAILARKAANLAARPRLAGWIHRVTLIECAEAMRREMTHQKKTQAASEHLHADSASREVWRDTLPILDEGIAALPKKDSEIIFLRFFERKSFREIGATLGKSDDAAQKQAERALEKLSAYLKRKGVVMSATALGPCLAVQLDQTASAALAESIARIATSSVPMWGAKIHPGIQQAHALYCRLTGHRVRLRFYGDGLVRVLPRRLEQADCNESSVTSALCATDQSATVQEFNVHDLSHHVR